MIDISYLVSFASLAVAVYVAISNSRRAKTKDDRNDASSLTTVIVKLENISDGVTEIKRDMSAVKNDIQSLRDRVLECELKIKELKKEE